MLVRMLTLVLCWVLFVPLSADQTPAPFLPPGDQIAAGEVLPAAVSDPRYPINVIGHVSLPYVEAFAVGGDYLYCVASWGFFIVDASNPAEAVVVSQVFFESGLYDNGVGLSGNHAYVIRRTTGSDRYLVSIDVSNPQAPVIVGECLLESLGYTFLNYGDYLVILDPGNIVVVDIADPTSPQFVKLQVRTSGSGGAIRGDKLFTVEGEDVRIVNLANPAELSTLAIDANFVNAEQLAIEGDRMYVVDRIEQDSYEIIALDITDASWPVELGRYTGPPYGQIAAIDAHVYGTRGQNEYVHVINFSDPASPTRVGSVATQSWGILRINNRLYFELLSKVSIFDASIPAAPLPIGSFEGTYSWAHDVDVKGNLAAMACGNLYLVDITDRANPQVLSSWFPPGYGAWSVELEEGVAYVADGEAINALDISDPAHPVLADRLISDYLSMEVAVGGGYGYSTGALGVQVIDLSDPLHPQPVTIYSEPDMEYTTSLLLRDQTLFVFSTYHTISSTVRILDVSEPAVPVKIGEYVTAYTSQGKSMELRGDYLYLIDGSGQFEVVDIRTPETPVKVGGTYISYGYAHTGSVIGEYLFSTARSLSIVDLYSPWYPQEVSTNYFGDRGEALCTDGTDIFLCANGTLLILEAPTPVILNGDCDNTGAVNISDAVHVINFIFNDGDAPSPYRSGDVNCDRLVTISDAVYLITWIFAGGPAPCQQ